MNRQKDPQQLKLGLRTHVPKFKDAPESLSFARELRTVLCLGKNKFKSARTVANAVRHINREGSLNNLVEAYDCPFCKYWHLMGIAGTEKGYKE